MTITRILELAVQCPHDKDLVDVVQFARAVEKEVCEEMGKPLIFQVRDRIDDLLAQEEKAQPDEAGTITGEGCVT